MGNLPLAPRDGALTALWAFCAGALRQYLVSSAPRSRDGPAFGRNPAEKLRKVFELEALGIGGRGIGAQAGGRKRFQAPFRPHILWTVPFTRASPSPVGKQETLR